MPIRLIVMCLTVILGACSTLAPTPAPTEPPFYTATPRPIPTRVSDGLGGTDIPLEFVGGNPLAVNLPGDFRFLVRGDVQAEGDSGTVVYNYVDGARGFFAHDQVFITASDGNTSQQLTFQFSPDLESGVYNIIPSERFVPGNVRAEYAYLGDDGFGNRVLYTFTDEVRGELTLERSDNALNGSFLFRAETTLTSDAGEEDTLEINIAGEFSDVPYTRLDTPFDTAPIEPTRATPEPRP